MHVERYEGGADSTDISRSCNSVRNYIGLPRENQMKRKYMKILHPGIRHVMIL